MVAPIIVAGIVAAITAITNVISGIVQASPTKGDRYRKGRIKQLEGLVDEGFTEAQEEELRAIGLGAAATAERETRSRRGEALAVLAGGATAQDILAAEARDTARARDTRLSVENEVTRADRAERQALRQELNQLTAIQDQRAAQKRAAVTQAITGVAQDAANITSAAAIDSTETGPRAVTSAAERQVAKMGNQQAQAGTLGVDGADPYATVAPIRSGMGGQAAGYGQSSPGSAEVGALRSQIESMTPEERARLLALLGITE